MVVNVYKSRINEIVPAYVVLCKMHGITQEYFSFKVHPWNICCTRNIYKDNSQRIYHFWFVDAIKGGNRVVPS